jgi:pyrroloquinoline-quinone synthase
MHDGFASILTTSAIIDAAVQERSMLAHPFYRAWEDGVLPRETLTDYSKQYFHHVEAFPRAVSAVHSNCPDARGRRLLAENLAEEEGLGEGKDDHAQLWLNFAAGLGADEASVRAVPLNAETQGLIDTFSALSRRSYASGLGALYAYESQLPGIASTKIKGLAERYGVADERTIRFFNVHEYADVEHAAVCRELIDALPADQREEALEGARQLSEALLRFLDGMHVQSGMVC